MEKVNRVLFKLPFFLILIIIACSISVSASSPITSSAKTDEIPYESYTYWEEYGSSSKVPVYSKPMYKVKTQISVTSFTGKAVTEIKDVCVDEAENVYILDSKDSKVFITDSSYNLIKVIDSITLNGEKQSIDGACGIFAKNEVIYIADTINKRAFGMNVNGEIINVIPEPDANVIPDDFNYAPTNIVIDSKGYMYILCDGSYYGAIVYSPEMKFLGFYGANTVKASVLDVIQGFVDKIFTNDVKKGSSILALPYQFTDIVLDEDDFIYTVTGRTNDSAVTTGQICKMNPGGKNILGRDDYNFLDSNVGIYNVKHMTQNPVSMAVDKDGFIFIIDRTYGRIFLYDSECNIMSVFGGSLDSSNQKGTFMYPTAITIKGTDLIVSDGMLGSITVFELTEYGKLFREANIKFLNDDFEEAIKEWQNITSIDKNNQVAYKGLAKGYYSIGEYEKAIKYAKLGVDRDTYAKSFAKLRDAILKKYSFIAIAILVVLIVAIIFLKKNSNGKIKTHNETKFDVMKHTVFHPVESYRAIREDKAGSLPLACGILVIYYLISAFSDKAMGFTFNYFDSSNYNSFYVFLRTVGLVVLFAISNWLISSIMGGLGRLKDIIIVVVYSLIPMIFSSILMLLLSYVLIPDEFVFVTLFSTVCLIYTIVLLTIGLIKIHDFSFGKFLVSIILTIVGMMIILFLIFLMFTLTQQLVGFVKTLYVEAVYR